MNNVMVSFSIRTKDLHPDLVTRLLCHDPDVTVVKGVARVPPKPYPDAHAWVIRRIDSLQGDVVGTVQEVILAIESIKDQIDRLKAADPTYVAELAIDITPFSHSTVLNWSSKILSLLGSVGATLDVSFHEET